MELLVLKSGAEYFRIKDEFYHLVQLAKATVFPWEKLEEVKHHQTQLRENGFADVQIKKLILTEEDL